MLPLSSTLRTGKGGSSETLVPMYEIMTSCPKRTLVTVSLIIMPFVQERCFCRSVRNREDEYWQIIMDEMGGNRVHPDLVLRPSFIPDEVGVNQNV